MIAQARWRRMVVGGAVLGVVAASSIVGCALFQSEQVSKGRELYNHYCSHCHGENGRQNEGYNWASMPDPKPKDLSNKSEMSTFKDEEIFNTISRDMKDTSPEGGDKIGDDEFAVPTMPTFKYTLSEEEIWSIVAYVRTLHGMKLTYNVEERKKEIKDALQAAQAKYDEAKAAYEAAEKKANEEAEQKGKEVDDDAYAKEAAALAAAKKALDEAKNVDERFAKRPKFPQVARPDLAMKPDAAEKSTELGKRLYTNKYGCNACHAVNQEGGKVGPALDRAGFRLNPSWVYRWIKYPQAMKPESRMPNLGISDQDAKAISLYLSTLRAPREAQVADKPAS
ncbi:C-type cytochrome [Nitrospira tepida]|uniref:C-type cytochrome n=1 Tax=Nitrospira tepida TaxID=2973512 RepID=A0AA86MX95_9BACT|nr:c-type cytochrome [Nitrospira tepida]CAI4030738.1 C-type cytochrome [Nitrospira tepida]